MPLPKFYKVCQDQNGNIVPQVLGSVFNQGTAVLASLYQDDAGTVPLANPMTSDAQYGSFKFYLNPGHYDLTFTKPGYTFESIMDFQVPQDVLTLGTMATQNANAVAITGGTVTQVTALTANGNATVAGSIGVAGGAPTAGYALVAGSGIASLPRLEVSYPAQTGFDVTIAGSVFLHTGLLALGVTSPGYSIHTTGQIGLPGGTGGIVNTTSRRALKRHVRPLTGALARLLRLREREWEWADPALEAGMPGTQMGLVTEEVAQDMPQWATQGRDGTPGHHERGSLALVVGAIRELVARIEALEARLS